MQYWSLRGLIPYEKASELQRKLVDLRARDQIPDTFLFLEHEPVITRGRGLQFVPGRTDKHKPLPPVLPKGVSFSESERGGDLTYHGPGQWVVYPIFKLSGDHLLAPHHDIAAFLRGIEKVLIDLLSELGLQAESRENATGVWVGDKKVASIGIAIRKWVSWHGLALNVVNDLEPFYCFDPCGFQPKVMASIQSLGVWSQGQGRAAAFPEQWRSHLENRWMDLVTKKLSESDSHTRSAEIRSLTLEDALAAVVDQIPEGSFRAGDY